MNNAFIIVFAFYGLVCEDEDKGKRIKENIPPIINQKSL